MLTLLLALLYTSGTWAQPAINPAEPWNWPDDYVVEQVNQVRAGRDLTPSSWPNGARVAVLLSYDVDNETVMGLRTGDISVGPLSQG
ncbi:MAG TPA: polysaccharide deacetylase, partial [Gammaproteobacteria bacterium]|nr:polysaccharide deacetylase [Gammaproteobacteria bacterium]